MGIVLTKTDNFKKQPNTFKYMESHVDKSELVRLMRKNPCDYHRECLYDYISSGFFTEDELVRRFGLLSKRAYKHIIKYPRITQEQECLPMLYKENEQTIPENIDVLFWGIPGGGGKTCLLAALMSLVGDSPDFLFQEYHDNKKCDNRYGKYLANYLKSNRLPPWTDSGYIAVIKTLIRVGSNIKGVSFIEFPGDQVVAMTENIMGESLSSEYIESSPIRIINNSNKKIIFITLDPTCVTPCYLNSQQLWVYQSDILSCVISHYGNDKNFMQNVIGLHFVVSKSDIWLHGSFESSIRQAMSECGANGLYGIINDVCKAPQYNSQLHHLHKRVVPVPFKIGNFMVGDTYEFDNSDAKKIFHIIQDDLMAYNESCSVWHRLKSFLNL